MRRRTLPRTLVLLALVGAAAGGCDGGEGKAEQLAPPIRPIPAAAKERSRDPRFDEYRKMLQGQFAALKRLGEFYSKATAGGSRPLSPDDLATHGQMRGETDRLAAECAAYIEANFPDESPDVIQQIYNEEQAKAMPDG